MDAIRDQLASDDNTDLRQSIYVSFMEDDGRGANMVIAFAKEKGLELEAKPRKSFNS